MTSAGSHRAPRAWLVASIATWIALTSAACATVRPWQRERLAHPSMQMDEPAGSAAFDSHVRAVRVGDARASATGGGGCGCN